jgi:hypothetical protein
MSKKFLSGIDLAGTQIVNILLHIIAGDAGSPADGQVWYNSTTDKFRGRANGVNVTFVNDGGDLTAGSVANTALATNPLARANHTGTQTASSISDFDTQVRTSRLDQMAAPTADVSLNTRKITGLGTPTAATDAATKGYVDTAVTGLSWKTAVRVATTANGTLATAFENGDVVDGVTLVTGDRILLKDQTTGGERGIYVVNVSGAPTRATDNDSGAEMLGAAVMVQEGTTNANTQWVQTVDGTITVGTTSTTWTQFGGGATYTAGNGLTLSTNDFAVGQGTGIIVNANDVAVDPAYVVRKYAANIGNGALTTITVNHALNTTDITYSIKTVSDGSIVEADVIVVDANNISVTFAVAPTTNQYRVTVHG